MPERNCWCFHKIMMSIVVNEGHESLDVPRRPECLEHSRSGAIDLGKFLNHRKRGRTRKRTSYSMPRSRTPSAGPFSKLIERWADKGREGDRAEHEAQILNDLKATGMKLRLLVNFGSYPNAEIERRTL